MSNQIQRFLASLRFVLVPLAVLSAPTWSAPANSGEILLEAPAPFSTTYTSEEFKQAVKVASKKTRAPAQIDMLDENTILSTEYRNIRNSFIGGTFFEKDGKQKTVPGAKSPEDIEALLNTLDTQFKANAYKANDARLLAAQLLMLKPMRGMIYRARNIFESKNGDAPFAHAAAVTMLRAVAAGIEVYLPTDQWTAAFDYSVQPFYDGDSRAIRKTCGRTWSQTCDIDEGPKFQAWLRNEVLPRLNDLNATLASMKFGPGNYVYMDNKILYGPADFVSSKDRFIRLGEAERLALLSATQLSMSSIYGVNAYQLNGFFASMNDVAKKYGFSAVFSAGGATAEKRFGVIGGYRNLFVLKKEALAKEYLEKSYSALKTGLQNAHLSWKTLESLQSDTGAQDNIIDPRLVGPFQRIVNTGFTNAFGIVGIDQSGNELASGEVVSAVVNGEKVAVNLKKFFTDPPSSLKDFMPTEFVGGNEFLSKNVNGEQISYRNYDKGNPAGWNYAVFQKYFPGATDAEGVKRTARVLSQSWGGFMLGLPLNLVMM